MIARDWTSEIGGRWTNYLCDPSADAGAAGRGI